MFYLLSFYWFAELCFTFVSGFTLTVPCCPFVKWQNPSPLSHLFCFLPPRLTDMKWLSATTRRPLTLQTIKSTASSHKQISSPERKEGWESCIDRYGSKGSGDGYLGLVGELSYWRSGMTNTEYQCLIWICSVVALIVPQTVEAERSESVFIWVMTTFNATHWQPCDKSTEAFDALSKIYLDTVPPSGLL